MSVTLDALPVRKYYMDVGFYDDCSAPESWSVGKLRIVEYQFLCKRTVNSTRNRKSLHLDNLASLSEHLVSSHSPS
jgi:hypothetical protein